MVRTKAKSRQQLAAENMTDAQKIARALQSGRLRSELRTVSEAIHAAHALAVQIGTSLAFNAVQPDSPLAVREGFNNPKPGEHFRVSIAYMTPDLSMLFTAPYTLENEAELRQRLSAPGMCCIPVGLIFGIRDPQQEQKWLFGARPFLDTNLVSMALKQETEDRATLGIN